MNLTLNYSTTEVIVSHHLDAEREADSAAPINSRLNVVVLSPTPVGFGPNSCWPSRGS